MLGARYEARRHELREATRAAYVRDRLGQFAEVPGGPRRPKPRRPTSYRHRETVDEFWGRMEMLGHERPPHLRKPGGTSSMLTSRGTESPGLEHLVSTGRKLGVLGAGLTGAANDGDWFKNTQPVDPNARPARQERKLPPNELETNKLLPPGVRVVPVPPGRPVNLGLIVVGRGTASPGRLGAMNAKQVVAALHGAGFEQVRQRGSHRVFAHPSGGRHVVVPDHGSRSLARGTLMKIRRTAGTVSPGLLLEGRVVFDPRAHPRDRRGRFAEVLGQLVRPGLTGRGARGELDVQGTPFLVRRERSGFVLLDDGGKAETFRSAEDAADALERRIADREREEESAALMAEIARDRAERAKRRAERQAESDAERRARRDRERAAFDAKYPVDEQGRRYFYRLESPTQSATVAAQQESSSEVWGRAPTNTFAGGAPKVQAYMGRLPEGARGVEFVTDVPIDPGCAPGLGDWSLSKGARSPGAGGPGLRVEGEFAKLPVVVTRNTQR